MRRTLSSYIYESSFQRKLLATDTIAAIILLLVATLKGVAILSLGIAIID